MSEENVELMRQTFERWNAGERQVDRDIAHPDMVVRSAIDPFRNGSEGRLLALGAEHVRGRTSGVEFDQPMALLLTFADESPRSRRAG